MYLSQVGRSGLTDSQTVNNGSFRFVLAVQQGAIYFPKIVGDTTIYLNPVFLMPGANCHLAVGSGSGRMTYSGSPVADEQNELFQGMYAFYERETEVTRKIKGNENPIETNRLKEERAAIGQLRKTFYTTWIRRHTDSPFSLAALFLYADNIEPDSLEGLYKSLSPQARNNSTLERAALSQLATSKFQNHFAVGSRLKDFSLPDTSGKLQSFYRLKGNGYVLLDFWASWCAPCRASTPELADLLRVYGDRNFKIISISADDDAAAWKAAIRNDNMYWPQLSDLKGSESGFIRDNFIFAFLTYILISPEGAVLARPYNVDKVKEDLVSSLGKTKADSK